MEVLQAVLRSGGSVWSLHVISVAAWALSGYSYHVSLTCCSVTVGVHG